MVDLKKYNGTAWVDTALRQYKTATEAVENPLYSDGTAITSYTIKGNTLQNGTPSPSNPVEVNGVGVRTENLFDWASVTTGYRILWDSGGTYADASAIMSDYISISLATYHNSTEAIIVGYDSNKNYIGTYQQNGTFAKQTGYKVSTFTISDSNCKFIKLLSYDTYQITPLSNTTMLNAGSTAKPYEPYGYKIPISSGGVTTNIYLGSTQTVRQIKKIVFDGTENWESRPNYNYADRFLLQKSGFTYANITGYSTHFEVNANLQDRYPLMTYNNGEQIVVNFTEKGTTTLAQFKQWLADQNTNGTPVTIYYVLKTAETAAVNEPLMKIGDYADSISNATAIPTTEGANSITVDTTVQPSEFTATWTGWHDASVKEWDGSQWS